MRREPQGHWEPEAFLKHVRHRTKGERWHELKIKKSVKRLLQRFLDNEPEFVRKELARLSRVLDGLHAALAAIISEKYSFDVNDELAPFRNEEQARVWLAGESEIGDAGEPSDFFHRNSDWSVRSLWDVCQEVEDELSDIVSLEKAHWKHHPSRPPDTPSQLPTDVQELIYDLCVLWHNSVDKNLGLPSKTAGKENELLRFIDACFAIVLGGARPNSQTVKLFISRYIRPAIVAEPGDVTGVDFDDSIPF
jgi:hypothetical protein